MCAEDVVKEEQPSDLRHGSVVVEVGLGKVLQVVVAVVVTVVVVHVVIAVVGEGVERLALRDLQH